MSFESFLMNDSLTGLESCNANQSHRMYKTDRNVPSLTSEKKKKLAHTIGIKQHFVFPKQLELKHLNHILGEYASGMDSL